MNTLYRIISISLFLSTNSLYAQSMVSSEKPTATANALYGWSTAIDGSWSVIASPQKDGTTLQSVGEVAFLRYNENEWSVQQTERPGGLPALSNFGMAVAMDYDLVAVSSIGDHQNGLFSGVVYLYQLENEVWNMHSVLKGSDVGFGDRFGNAIDIMDDVMVIGAYMGDGNESRSGTVYLFERNGSDWNETAKLFAEDGTNGDYFGYSVEIIDQNTLAIGAYRADGSETETGAVYIFERSEDGWIQAAKLESPNGETYDVFGYSLESFTVSSAFSDEPLLFVGVPGSKTETGSSGAVYAYSKIADEWQLRQIITNEEALGNSHFGVSMATDHINKLYVGASRIHSENQKESGKVFSYTIHSDTEEYSFLQDMIFETASEQEFNHFGATVSASGNFVLISSPYKNRDGFTNSGDVHFYQNLTVSNEGSREVITTFELFQNYPNPFNPSTTIDYQVPQRTQVSLKVYDMLGREVAVLINNETVSPGRYQITFNASNLSSGMYIYQLRTSENVMTKKLTLIK